ncbi:MAG: hypothetical protein JWN44_3681 [Myxococcales bacterium]|nr:hypothetical protein [Myxococcales bacterium]
MPSDGFTWSGSLDETDIQSLYAACQSLRFSGKLELRDGAIRAEVTFVGGEPIEIDGGDTQRIALWNRGNFRAVQSIPNLAGELTGQRHMEGSLAITKASQLWAWVSEYRLTCEIDLERPGSRAVVSFSNGHAESAQVNGAPELAALARVSSWTDGTFRVRLKPLFLDGIIHAPPPMPESASPSGRQFDVSRSIPMDLKLREQQKLQGASFGPPKPVPPTPPLGELAMGGMSSGPSRPHEERTSETRPLPPPEFAREAAKGSSSKRSPFDPMELSKPYPRHDETGAVRPRSSMPWLLSLTGILIAGAFGALYYYHLPPFSPPPKPVEAPTGETVKPSGEAALPSGGAVKPSGEAVKPSGEAVRPSGQTVKPSGEAVKPSGEAVKPTGEAVKPSGEAVRPSGQTVKPSGVTQKPEPKEKPTDKLVARGRLLLIEGHSHTALEQFRRASKMAPKDASLKVYEAQAAGKLGKAQILLDGKGSLVVDGHKFSAPAKVKLMAGPHLVDAGDGENEVTLKRGEKRHIRVKK